VARMHASVRCPPAALRGLACHAQGSGWRCSNVAPSSQPCCCTPSATAQASCLAPPLHTAGPWQHIYSAATQISAAHPHTQRTKPSAGRADRHSVRHAGALRRTGPCSWVPTASSRAIRPPGAAESSPAAVEAAAQPAARARPHGACSRRHPWFQQPGLLQHVSGTCRLSCMGCQLPSADATSQSGTVALHWRAVHGCNGSAAMQHR
jgi:hypothetical protein